jgi:hypothetical protein
MKFSGTISPVKWLNGGGGNVSKAISVLVLRVLIWMWLGTQSVLFIPVRAPCSHRPHWLAAEMSPHQEGMSEVPHGQTKRTDVRQASQGNPLQGGQVDATSSTQHCSSALTEVFRDFAQL